MEKYDVCGEHIYDTEENQELFEMQKRLRRS